MSDSIGLDEHVFIGGITGGGKSYLAENYLATRPPVIKLDTKGEAVVKLAKKPPVNPWPQVPPGQLSVILDFDSLTRHNFKKRPFVIYHPDPEETDKPGFFNELFRWIFLNFKKTGVRLWIDELKDVNESPHKIDKYLKFMYTKGRFFNMSVWGLSQEPRHIHSLTMSQASHVFAFDMPRKEDRTRLADNTGVPQFLELPTGYQFWYFRRGWRDAVKGVMEG